MDVPVGNYLKMVEKQRILALLELGWSYRRIERETGVCRETIARYDPWRGPKPAKVTAGSASAKVGGQLARIKATHASPVMSRR